MNFIKRKALFFLLGGVLLVYFSLPFLSEKNDGLGLFIVESPLFNPATIPYYTVQLVFNNTFIATLVQLVVFLLSWLGCYSVISFSLNVVEKIIKDSKSQ